MSDDAPKRSGSGKKSNDAPAEGPKTGAGRMWGVAAALAGLAAIAYVATRSSQPSSGDVAAGARPVTGTLAGYKLEVPAGWHTLDVNELGKDRAPDFDLALGRDDAQGAVLVLVEKLPPTFSMEPRRYFEILAENMKKNSPGTEMLEVEPLAQDASRGFVQHLTMPDSRGPREGYLATLLTPKWGFRVLATAPVTAFAARKADLLHIIGSFTPPPDSASPAASSSASAK